jgi:hypothetical protein
MDRFEAKMRREQVARLKKSLSIDGWRNKGATTLGVTTLNITTFSITILSVILCHFALFHYADCRFYLLLCRMSLC